MSPRLSIALPVLLSAALLVSCSSVERVIRPRLVIPPSLLTCSDYPQPPDQTASDVDLAVYMLRGEDAWRDCRDTLADVSALVATQSPDN